MSAKGKLFFLPSLTNNLKEREKIWKQLSRKSKYKIIVICTGLGLLVGGFFLLKPTPQTPVKETNLQAEVAAVSKNSSIEKEVKKEEKRKNPFEQDLITVDVKGAVKAPGIYDLPVGSQSQ